MTESIQEALELKPCPLCGSKFLMGREPHDNHPVGGKFYLFHQCRPLGSPAEKCPIDVHGHFDTAEEAAAIWNTRATLQPDGERREAIARALERHDMRDYGWTDKQFEVWWTKDDRAASSREQQFGRADMLLASGLVQNEAGWRDISTAPKDGTRILWSCGDDKMSVIHWPEYDLCFESGYWQPLPAPPIRSARDGGAET